MAINTDDAGKLPLCSSHKIELTYQCSVFLMVQFDLRKFDTSWTNHYHVKNFICIQNSINIIGRTMIGVILNRDKNGATPKVFAYQLRYTYNHNATEKQKL